MAAILKVLITAILDAIIQRLPVWIEDMHKRQAAALAEKKLATDQAKIDDFLANTPHDHQP